MKELVQRWWSRIQGGAPGSPLQHARVRSAAAHAWLCLVYGLVFVACFREPEGTDDSFYFEAAAGLDPDYVNGHRLGLVWPVRFFYWAFGYNAAAYYAVPLLSGLGLTLVLYRLGRLYLPRIPAALAATAFITNPDVMREIALLLPDIPSLFWFCFGVYFLLKSLDERVTDEAGRRQALLSGAGFFLAWLTKESAALQFLPVPLLLLFVKRTPLLWRNLGIAAGTALGLLCAEVLVYTVVEGDPLFRANVVSGRHLVSATRDWVPRGLVAPDLGFSDLALRFIATEHHQRHEFYQKYSLFGISYLDLLLLAFFSGAASMLLHRRWQLGFLGTLAFSTWALLSFSVVDLDPLVPLLRNKPRYFFCVLCFALLFSVASWYEFWLFLRRKAKASRLIALFGPLLAVLAVLCMALFARRTVFKRSPLREGDQIGFVARSFVREQAAYGTPVRSVYGGGSVLGLRVLIPESLVSHRDIHVLEKPGEHVPRAGELLLRGHRRPFLPGNQDLLWVYTPVIEKQVLSYALAPNSRTVFSPHALRVLWLPSEKLSALREGTRVRMHLSARIERGGLARVLLSLEQARAHEQRWLVRHELNDDRLLVAVETPAIEPSQHSELALDLFFSAPTLLTDLKRSVSLVSGTTPESKRGLLKLERLP